MPSKHNIDIFMSKNNFVLHHPFCNKYNFNTILRDNLIYLNTSKTTSK